MSERPEERQTFIKELLGLMPPNARAVLMWLLMFPLAIAISGLLLNVNVGSLIERSVSKTRTETVDIVGQMLYEKLNRLDNQVSAIDEAIKRQGIRYWEMDKRLTYLERGASPQSPRQE